MLTFCFSIRKNAIHAKEEVFCCVEAVKHPSCARDQGFSTLLIAYMRFVLVGIVFRRRFASKMGLENVSAGNTSSRAGVVIVADDLTGACDAAVAFSCQGVETEVVLNWRCARNSSAEVVAIDTESREIPVQEAVTRLESVSRQLDLKAFVHIFKKVDSVFRGNTFDEIATTVREFPSDLAIMAPAYPALGRTSMDGIVRVHDIVGERTFAVWDRLHAAGLHPRHIPAGRTSEEVAGALRVSLQEGHRFVYCDAYSEEDLHAVVRGGEKLEVRILWIGSAGLAHALALNMSSDIGKHLSFRPGQVPRVAPSSGIVVFFVGSDHPVTQEQMISLRKQTNVIEHSFEAPLSIKTKFIGPLVVPVRWGYTTERDICSAMEGLNQEDVSCLFITGGNSATLVCRALGINSLQLQDEFEPGLPCGVAVDGPFAGRTVILKSGGFGETDVLCRIAKTYQPDSHRKIEDAH